MAVDDLRTERICTRCGYTMSPHTYHEEMPQPEGSNVVVCSLARSAASMRGPLVEVLDAYFRSEQLRRRAWAIPLPLSKRGDA